MGTKASRLAKKAKGKGKRGSSSSTSTTTTSTTTITTGCPLIESKNIAACICEEQIVLLCEYWIRKEDLDGTWDDWYIPIDLIRIIWTFIFLKSRFVDDFEWIKVLGRSKMNKTYLVRDKLAKTKEEGKTKKEIYVLKSMRKERLHSTGQIEYMYQELELFKRISESENNGIPCPFLLHLRWSFETDRKIYFVTDFIDSGELFFYLRKKKRLKENECMSIGAEIALALDCLHSRFQVIFRDLKPENILLDNQGHITLMDFGLIKTISEDTKLETHTFCGTPEYLSPEVVTNVGHSYPTDWWGLGIMLYEMSIGIPPFYSQNINEMYRKIQEAPLLFPPRTSINLKVLIMALLQRDPLKRAGTEGGLTEICEYDWWYEQGGDNYETDKDMWMALSTKQFDPPFKPVKPREEDDWMKWSDEYKVEIVKDSPCSVFKGEDVFDFSFNDL